MSAHLRCHQCGRHAWRELQVGIGPDGLAHCNGDDCAEWTARIRPVRDLSPAEMRPVIHGFPHPVINSVEKL